MALALLNSKAPIQVGKDGSIRASLCRPLAQEQWFCPAASRLGSIGGGHKQRRPGCTTRSSA